MNYRTKLKLTPYMFLATFLVLFAVFMIYPILYSFVLSFGNYKGQEVVLTGLRNYQYILNDAMFRKALVNTFVIMLIQVPIMIFLSLTLSVLINSKLVKLRGVFRTGVFVPVLIDAVSYTIVFSLFFSETGIINSSLQALGFSPLGWFTNGLLAKMMIVFAVNWKWTGYNAVIMLAGLQNIPTELYEAASIDGASALQRFFRITLPQLKPIMLFVTITSINGSLQMFTEPNLLTRGGPTNQTLTVMLHLYNIGFKNFNFGVACAGAYLLLVIIGIVTFIQLRITREED